METRGQVSREPCLTDQRGAVIAITPKGTNLIKAAAPKHVADVRYGLIDLLTESELKTLITIGDKVREQLAETASVLGPPARRQPSRLSSTATG